ncbi:hypothetical protein E3O67_07940 [Cryobacterium sp. TMT3-29-2]|nr:hypothetical protein E3O67_07940 [Cryobacterium sp. TMT3-29-2]
MATAQAGPSAAAAPLASAGTTGPTVAGATEAPTTPIASAGTTGTNSLVGAAAPRSALGTSASSGTNAPRSALGTSDSSGTNAPRSASGARASAGASSGAGAGAGTARPASVGRPPGGSRPGKPRLRIWIAGGLVLVLALAALFFLGQSLVGGDATPVAVSTSSTAPAPSATPSTAPLAPAEATGPQPVGDHPWDTLFGGECLQPYVSPWEDEFTVADCAAPHAAQLVYRGLFAGDTAAPFPGEAELAGQINLLCSATGVIDLAAASAYDDVQVQGSYPITEKQWFEGARYYYCFVSRASGEPLTASVAGPGPEPAA